ncbi:hypothetical protein DOY81_011210, partial [Sarcophaga bullata]
EIPPQPLRPAPAPVSSQSIANAGHTKIVTFSVNLENEGPYVSHQQYSHKENNDMFRSNILQSNLKRPVDIPVLEARLRQKCLPPIQQPPHYPRPRLYQGPL